MFKILMVFVILVVACQGFNQLGAFVGRSNNAHPPQLHQDEWWGPEYLQGNQDTSIRPFRIEFSDEMIQDLRSRLKNHRTLTPPLNGTAFEYGFNTNQMDGWVDYWADEYPFKERELFFNQFPQYKTNIQGLDIHFIRVKPQVPPGIEVVPILLMHGWPGSIREFYEVIPLLTKPAPGYNFAFEVIAPSLPGYGYSAGAVRPGLAVPQIAVIFKNLMNRLGFKKFYIQGGDWGSRVASDLATLYPDLILGHHTNFAVVLSAPAIYRMFLADLPSLVLDQPNHMSSLYSFIEFMIEEGGFFHIQATKPDTVGVGLTDSPVGLLAYILEKFGTFTRIDNRYKPDGGITSRFTKDQVIDNLMMYWVPSSITTSFRLYAEETSRKNLALNLASYTTPVPTWALQAKHELFYQPPSILKIKFSNLLGNTMLDDGGHFLALELPDIFAKDVFKAVKAFRDFHNRNTHHISKLFK